VDDDVDDAEYEHAVWVLGGDDSTDYEAMGAPELAQAYLEFVVDSRGARGARLRAAVNAGVHNEVFERLRVGPDPMALVDAIVRCDPSDEDLWSLGAGVMEDFLQWRPEHWEMVDDRCSHSAVWAQMASGVWLRDSIREQMPPGLRALIPSVFGPEEESRRGRRAREKAERKARTRKSWNGRTAPRRLQGAWPQAADLDLLLAALRDLGEIFSDPSAIGTADDDAAWSDLLISTVTDGLGNASITRSAADDALDICTDMLDRTGRSVLSAEAEDAVRRVVEAVRGLAEHRAPEGEDGATGLPEGTRGDGEHPDGGRG
jgi:hypothetical protein